MSMGTHVTIQWPLSSQRHFQVRSRLRNCRAISCLTLPSFKTLIAQIFKLKQPPCIIYARCRTMTAFYQATTMKFAYSVMGS
jgi:hypothetical protein